MTDPIFQAGRIYRTPLVRNTDDQTIYGFLQLHYDTAFVAEAWMERAAVTFLNGMVRALVPGLVLSLVFHILLTRPLFRIINSLSRVNPNNRATPCWEHRRDMMRTNWGAGSGRRTTS